MIKKSFRAKEESKGQRAGKGVERKRSGNFVNEIKKSQIESMKWIRKRKQMGKRERSDTKSTMPRGLKKGRKIERRLKEINNNKNDTKSG